MSNMELRKAWLFFLENAGYCTPPGRVVCAMNLAKAERWAQEQGVTAKWVYDDEPYEMGDAETEMPSEVLGCVLTHGDETVSLWSIGDPSPEYRRVVEAELALELQIDFFQALAVHVRSL